MAASEAYSLMAAIKFYHWKRISDRYENIWQLHLGSKIKLKQTVDLRLGFFSQQDPVSKSFVTRFNEYFFTIGIDKRLSEKLAISFSWQDTHIWDPASYQQLWKNDNDGYFPSSICLAASYEL